MQAFCIDHCGMNYLIVNVVDKKLLYLDALCIFIGEGIFLVRVNLIVT